MLFITPLPLASERVPLATSLLLLVNIAAFAIFWPLELKHASTVSVDQLSEEAQKLCAILLKDGSGLSEADRALVTAESAQTPMPSAALKDFFERVEENPYSPALSSDVRYRWEMNYPIYAAMAKSIAANPTATSPYRRWGFRSMEDWWPGIFTHQFLHVGIWHLLFNMIFLWVVGDALEQRLGAGVFLLFLAGGAAGAAAQACRGFSGTEFMVGASGAISALMGCALILVPKAKVKLGYVLFLSLIPRYGIFDAPLWFFIPLWVFEQVVMALMTAKDPTAHVGYFAHVGGFAFGLFSALAILPFIGKRSAA